MGKKKGNKRNVGPLTLEGATSSNPAVPKSDTFPRDKKKESKSVQSEKKSTGNDDKISVEGGDQSQGLRSLSLGSSNASEFFKRKGM